jgi:pimeloyl-ACP methyl ester carboxylesterase
MSRPTVTGAFSVANDGRKLELRCWGEGSPTIILEAGYPSAGIEQFVTNGRPFTERLAEQRKTCAYDRAGNGASDAAPMEPRDIDDVTDDLHALLAAAHVEGPYVLVGSSFGGMIVTYYAHRFPDGIRGVVLLDVPAPSATLTLTEAPELAWDSPQNPEHADVVPEFENRLAKERFAFMAPLLVITATRGQSNVADQAFWLGWSADSRQIELDGEHTVYNDQPVAIADAIVAMGD